MMEFKGVYTALITPFRNGEIDWDALRKIVELQVAGRIGSQVEVAPEDLEKLIRCSFAGIVRRDS